MWDSAFCRNVWNYRTFLSLGLKRWLSKSLALSCNRTVQIDRSHIAAFLSKLKAVGTGVKRLCWCLVNSSFSSFYWNNNCWMCQGCTWDRHEENCFESVCYEEFDLCCDISTDLATVFDLINRHGFHVGDKCFYDGMAIWSGSLGRHNTFQPSTNTKTTYAVKQFLSEASVPFFCAWSSARLERSVFEYNILRLGLKN